MYMNDIDILSNENALFVIITIINMDYIHPNKKRAHDVLKEKKRLFFDLCNDIV